MRCISVLLLLLVFSQHSNAQGTWAGESRVPDEFAKAVIERLRLNFWSKMRLPNGELIEPATEDERKTIPIPERLAFSLVTAGALAAMAESCQLNAEEFERRVTRDASDSYPNLRQIMFSATLLNLAKGIVKKQPAEGPCTDSQRTGFAALLAIK